MTADALSAPERWCAGLGRWSRLGLAFLAGALLTAGHAPIGLPWLAFLALPLMVWLMVGSPSARVAAWTGWAAGFGYFVTGLHWVGNAFLVDPDRFLLLLPLGVLGLPAGLALFWAVAFWGARRIAFTGWRAALVLSTTLGAVELARGYVLTGFPWALPAYIWLDTPIMQTASWIGPFTLTVLTLLVCAIPLTAEMRREVYPAALCLACVVILFAVGWARLGEPEAPDSDQPLIRLVQPNAPQHLKWEPGYREEYYDRLLKASAAPSRTFDAKPDLILWPEMSVYFVPTENLAEIARISEAAQGATVILGAFHRELRADGTFLTNAFHTILPDGTLGPRYDKHHLVPFGEYMPLAGVLGSLGLPDFSEGAGFARGDGPMTMHLPGLPSFSPNICYESIFPYKVVGSERPEWIAQITNDAWFGSFAGPQQHLAQARFRAVEQGLPVVRATNTGISAVIDGSGRIVASIDLHRYDSVDVRLPPPLSATVYSKTGDISCIVLLLIITASIFQMYRRSG